MKTTENMSNETLNNGVSNYSNKRVILGILFVGIGSVLIINNFGLLPPSLKPIILSWQMLLIAIGSLNLIFGGKKTTALITLSIGTFFIIPKIFDIPVETRKLFWPTIFIIIGLVMIFVRNRQSKRIAGGASNQFLDIVSIFGGGSQKVTTDDFKGGSVVTVFGGSEIDLSNATIKEDEITIDLISLFGGTTIIVPAEWDVKIDMVSILGGFKDNRNKIVTDIPGIKRKVLHITGASVFGGGELKSY
jgi:predicted membrane protein